MSDDSTVLETSIPYETLDTTLDVLRSLSDEAVMKIGKDGIQTALVDPANVAMHHVNVGASAFDITPPGQFALGVNLERFQDYIGKADSDQSIALAFDTETRKLNIRYANKDIKLAAIDPDSIRNEPDQPELELPNSFTTTSETFKDALEMTDFVSDHVHIRVNPDEENVMVEAEGDIDDVSVELDRDDLLEASLNETTESKFSMAYLVGGSGSKANDGIVNVVPKDAEVRVTVGDSYPLWLDYEYAGGNASVRSMLAPRVDT